MENEDEQTLKDDKVEINLETDSSNEVKNTQEKKIKIEVASHEKNGFFSDTDSNDDEYLSPPIEIQRNSIQMEDDVSIKQEGSFINAYNNNGIDNSEQVSCHNKDMDIKPNAVTSNGVLTTEELATNGLSLDTSLSIKSSGENSASFITQSPFSIISPDTRINNSQVLLGPTSYTNLADCEDDYFEEFHLPNTHENAFVRHLSFRRKVQKTSINAPDADRIEGLVRTGEFVRHGSIRKKILPEQDEEEYEDDEDLIDENEYMSDFNFVMPSDNTDDLKEWSHKTSSSTPLNSKGSIISINTKDTDFQPISLDEFEENVNIEESTLRKVKDCLDYSSYRDILNLCGRLSDLLSPKEVEEVLNNAERYRKYLDSEVLEALSLSYEANMKSLIGANNEIQKSDQSKDEQNLKSINNIDSGFSSPKAPRLKVEASRTFSVDSQNLTSLRIVSCPIDGIAAEGIFVETPMPAESTKKRLIVPNLTLMDTYNNMSLDTEEDTSSDNIIGDNGPAMPIKKKITVSEDILNGTSTTDDSEITYDNEMIHMKMIYENENVKNINDSMKNLEFNGSNISLSSSNNDMTKELNQSQLCPGGSLMPPDLIPELSAADEMAEERHWRNVVIGGAWRRIDMKVITPYRRCVSHGGYLEVSKNPIVVLSSSLLPERTRRDYHYVMDNIFMYILSFVEQLASDDYILVYLTGGKQVSGPGFTWMKKAYEMIDRRLRKNLKSLLIVHPTMWTKTLVTLFKPFISSKFYRKLHFVNNLTELAQIIPLDQLEIPDIIKQADFELMIKEKKKSRR